MAQDAKQALESQKRWVELAFNTDNPQIYNCENQLSQFKALYEQKKGDLAGSAWEKEEAEYVNGLEKKLAALTMSEEYRTKINNALHNLKWVSNYIDTGDFEQAKSKWNECAEVVMPMLAEESKYNGIAEFQELVAQYRSSESTIPAKIAEMEGASKVAEDLQRLENKAAPMRRLLGFRKESRDWEGKMWAGESKKWESTLKDLRVAIDKCKALGHSARRYLESIQRAEEIYREADSAWQHYNEWCIQKKGNEGAQAAIKKKYGDIDRLITVCISQKQCTFTVTGKEFRKQPWYECADCPKGWGMCVVCRDLCHTQGRFANHKVAAQWKTSNFFCDCGCEKKDCKALAPGGKEAATVTPAPAGVAASVPSGNRFVFTKGDGDDDQRDDSVLENGILKKIDGPVLAKFDLANKTFADAQDHPRGRYDETHFWDKNGKLCGEIIGDVVWSYQDGDKEKVGHLDKNMALDLNNYQIGAVQGSGPLVRILRPAPHILFNECDAGCLNECWPFGPAPSNLFDACETICH